MATGWLGLSPRDALNTPIPQIELALDGLIEWTRKTHPFAAPEPEKKPSVAEKLKAAFRAMGAKREDHGEH